MKRRIITSLLAIILIVTFFVSCEENNAETIQSETVQETVGSYRLFRTNKEQEYLTFLENFDETNYEIVDISTSMKVYLKGSDEFYMVTYKVISESE